MSRPRSAEIPRSCALPVAVQTNQKHRRAADRLAEGVGTARRLVRETHVPTRAEVGSSTAARKHKGRITPGALQVCFARRRRAFTNRLDAATTERRSQYLGATLADEGCRCQGRQPCPLVSGPACSRMPRHSGVCEWRCRYGHLCVLEADSGAPTPSLKPGSSRVAGSLGQSCSISSPGRSVRATVA